jgi:hypothetical protein
VVVELVQRWLEGDTPPVSQSPDEWLEEWFRLADEASKNVPPGPTASEILNEDRARLDR